MLRQTFTFRIIFALFALSFCAYNLNAQLTVDNSMTPQQLVQNVLLGTGVTVTNIQFTGHATAIGSFNGQATNVGIPTGVILASGNISDAIGPNNLDFSGDNLNQPGDIQLTNIAGFDTYDAAILEFDFVPSSDTVRFNYVFGSEEYPEYVCSDYNDVFAFFLSGPNPMGGNYNNKNIALIPGTNTPVAINSVNSGTPGGGYSSSQCTSLAHSNYYVDNTNGSTIQYDGFTKVFEAVAQVVPCQTYHIKIAIADAGDGIYDSGVFLEAKSFSSPTITISAIGSTSDSLMVEGCGAAVYTFTRDNAASAQPFTINYIIGGTATNGVDYQDLNGNPIVDSVYFLPGQDSAFLIINPIFDGIPEGEETVTLLIPQVLSCTNDTIRATIYIKNVDPMNVQIEGETLICPPTLSTINQNIPSDSILLNSTLSGGYGPFYYDWYTSTDTTTLSTESSHFVQPEQSTTYILTVRDTCGNATVSNSITVEVECPIELFNVFTPNGDGFNDKFEIKFIEHYPGSKLVVFNRWGKIVYESTDYKNDWDGSGCSDGVYYFILDQVKDGETNQHHGTVTILR